MDSVWNEKDEKQASIEPFRIDDLPPELLAEIFRCADTTPPSEHKARDEPEPRLFTEDNDRLKTLKNISLVNTKWRALSLPILFKHVIWTITPSTQVDLIYFYDTTTTFPILKFLMDKKLTNYVESFTMVVPSKLPDLFFARSDRATRNFSWDFLFNVLDLLRITILGKPEVLTSLVSRMLFNGGRSLDTGKQLYHILSLDRKGKSKPGTNAIVSAQETPPHRIFTIRPWTHLLLNEGSSIRIYRNYEYFLHRPPSILGHLLGCEEAPNDVPLVPPTLNSMSYIAIFPLCSHFDILIDNLPHVDKLFVQIVPQNDIMKDSVEMDHVNPADLWMERNSCHSHVMRRMLAIEDDGLGYHTANHPVAGPANQNEPPPEPINNWDLLREFESGDYADQQGWDLAVKIFTAGANTGWHVEREGVFVRPNLDPQSGYGTALPRPKMDGESGPADSLL
ncbi:putative f-box domain-protein [Podospora fimiseda]|uniref:F-box domain-protein n=1 Tax=Podospora fimiseda TaxID=252190 RepID=A0AAN7BLQ8_9PEZI|nr:putative f-box domain-protein [Podospora fimiseda]